MPAEMQGGAQGLIVMFSEMQCSFPQLSSSVALSFVPLPPPKCVRHAVVSLHNIRLLQCTQGWSCKADQRCNVACPV